LRPALVEMSGSRAAFGHVADPIERDFDVRRIGRGRGARGRGPRILTGALRRPESAARAAREWVTLAKRVEDLPANASGGVSTERSTAVAAISASRLHQPDQAPGDEVLAVGAAAARVDGSGGDRSRELKVRDDAVISNRNNRLGHTHLPCGADRNQASARCQ
jgi:hypothetical protein